LSEYIPDRNKIIAEIEKKEYADGMEILVERIVGEYSEDQ